MKKHIAFFAHHPDSANALTPMIHSLKNEYDVSLFAFHPYVAKCWNTTLFEQDTLTSIDFSCFDLVLYGTGSPHEAETLTPFYANQVGVPSIAFMDIFWANDDNIRRRFAHVPSFVVVPNLATKKQLLSLNILPEQKILPFGNPHFDRLEKFRSLTNSLSFPLNIVCFSQSSDGGSFSDTHEHTQKMLRLLAVIAYSKPSLIKHLFITPHPREKTDWLEGFIKPYSFMTLETNAKSFSLLLETDLSIGTNSTLQYEGLMIGKPTIFYENTKQFLSDFMQLNTVHLTESVSYHATKKITNWIHSFLKGVNK